MFEPSCRSERQFRPKLSAFSAENEKNESDKIRFRRKTKLAETIKIVIFGTENETEFRSVSTCNSVILTHYSHKNLLSLQPYQNSSNKKSILHTALKSGLRDNTTSKSGKADLDFPMAKYTVARR